MNLVNFIEQPMLGIRIFSGRTSGHTASDADFFAPPLNHGVVQPKIGYNPTTHSVVLNWSIEYPNNEWLQTARMGSIHDLDSATLCFYLANIPDFLSDAFKPIALNLKFGKTSIKVSKFELQSYENIQANHAKPFYLTNTIVTEWHYLYKNVWYETNKYVEAKPDNAAFSTFYTTNTLMQTNSFNAIYRTNVINLVRERIPARFVFETNRVAVWGTILPPPTYDPIRIESNSNSD